MVALYFENLELPFNPHLFLQLTALFLSRRQEQQCRLKRQSQRFSKLHLYFSASAVCNNVNY